MDYLLNPIDLSERNYKVMGQLLNTGTLQPVDPMTIPDWLKDKAIVRNMTTLETYFLDKISYSMVECHARNGKKE